LRSGAPISSETLSPEVDSRSADRPRRRDVAELGGRRSPSGCRFSADGTRGEPLRGPSAGRSLSGGDSGKALRLEGHSGYPFPPEGVQELPSIWRIFSPGSSLDLEEDSGCSPSGGSFPGGTPLVSAARCSPSWWPRRQRRKTSPAGLSFGRDAARDDTAAAP